MPAGPRLAVTAPPPKTRTCQGGQLFTDPAWMEPIALTLRLDAGPKKCILLMPTFLQAPGLPVGSGWTEVPAVGSQ